MAQTRYARVDIKPSYSEKHSTDPAYHKGTAVESEYHIFESLQQRQRFIDQILPTNEKYLPGVTCLSPKAFRQSVGGHIISQPDKKYRRKLVVIDHRKGGKPLDTE